MTAAAYEAAYDVLAKHTQHAQVRADIAERLLYEIRQGVKHNGADWTTRLATDDEALRDAGLTAHLRMPEAWRMSVPTSAITAALKAAATVLADA
jgi:hypothetical protein